MVYLRQLFDKREANAKSIFISSSGKFCLVKTVENLVKVFSRNALPVSFTIRLIHSPFWVSDSLTVMAPLHA